MRKQRVLRQAIARYWWALVVIALLLVGIIAYMSLRKQQAKSGSNSVITYSTDNPSEERPGSDYAWQGGPNDPKKIIIPAIGVDAFVQKVAVDQNKEVAVPNNLFVVGWFVDTVRPGQKGLSLIDGHVTGRSNDGIFKNLDKLQVGDGYYVELGDGTKLSYEVTGKKSAPTKESVSIMFSQDPKVASQLNLVTCGGKYDEKTRSYDQRLTILSKKL